MLATVMPENLVQGLKVEHIVSLVVCECPNKQRLCRHRLSAAFPRCRSLSFCHFCLFCLRRLFAIVSTDLCHEDCEESGSVFECSGGERCLTAASSLCLALTAACIYMHFTAVFIAVL